IEITRLGGFQVADVGDARAVDQHVDPAVVQDLSKTAVNHRLVRDIAQGGYCSASGVVDLLRCRRRLIHVDVQDVNRRTSGGEQTGHRPTNAARASGHHDAFAVEVKVSRIVAVFFQSDASGRLPAPAYSTGSKWSSILKTGISHPKINEESQ